MIKLEVSTTKGIDVKSNIDGKPVNVVSELVAMFIHLEKTLPNWINACIKTILWTSGGKKWLN